MSIIGKFVENNKRATVRDIMLHVEEELEIGWARDTMKMENSFTEEIARERKVLYAKLGEAKEQLKSIVEPYELQADEVVTKETGKKSTKDGRERWVEIQLRSDSTYQALTQKIENITMDIASVDLRKTMNDADVKRAKYNFNMYEAMVSALRLMVEHKETVIN